MPPHLRASVPRLVFPIALFLILACSPLSLVQQQAPTPSAQALATRPSNATTVRPTATRAAAAPTAAPTTAVKYALIAFVSDRDGAPELYTMKPDGTAQTRLTTTQGKDTLPVWSPDGARIAFLSERSGMTGLYTMGADGSNATLVFKDSLNSNEAPAWSPDGKRIAIVDNQKELSQIFVVNADGSGKTRVTDGKADEFSPAWSPDGTRIVFQSRRDKNVQAFIVNVDGSGLTRLTLDPAANWVRPIFSPDGKKIALVKVGLPSRIYTMNTDGSALGMLAESDGVSTHLSWSPDGKKIVFNREVNGKDQVFVVDADGKSAPVALTGAGKNYFPSWCCSAAPVTMLDAPQATLVAQPASTPAANATSASSSSGDSAVVKKALDAMSAQSYRGALKGPSQSASFEYSPVNNYHIVMGSSEVILIGDTNAYMKSGGKWGKTDTGTAGLLLLPIVIGSGYADKITNVKTLPNEALNGVSMQVLTYTGQYNVGGASGQGSGIQYKMWIGADGLPRQVTWQETGQPAATTTFQYDSSIKITAPALQ